VRSVEAPWVRGVGPTDGGDVAPDLHPWEEQLPHHRQEPGAAAVTLLRREQSVDRPRAAERPAAVRGRVEEAEEGGRLDGALLDRQEQEAARACSYAAWSEAARSGVRLRQDASFAQSAA
jgi:hypothetical protein